MPTARPIIIVTGANGGIGYGICARLLSNLAERSPLDAKPQFPAFAPSPSSKAETFPCQPQDGLSLIMACRSTKRGEVAKEKLFRDFDSYIGGLQRSGADKQKYEDAKAFREALTIEVGYCDLAALDSVFRFAEEVSKKYSYVSHLICNAGVASFTKIHWPTALKQMLLEPMVSVTSPEYNLQRAGELSTDGLGWVWQSNVFGHYALYRSLQPLLARSRSVLGSRVIWMSSLEASPKFLTHGGTQGPLDDWQLVDTDHSYEGSKYEIDLIGTILDREEAEVEGGLRIRHFIAQPGVCSTSISAALVSWFSNILKVFTFYLARWAGSPHHTIKPYIAAISAVHLTLVALAAIPVFEQAPPSASKQMKESIAGGHPLESRKDDLANGSALTKTNKIYPVRFGSETDRWGTAKVGVTPVRAWGEHQDVGRELVGKCQVLYDETRRGDQRPREVETASERM